MVKIAGLDETSHRRYNPLSDTWVLVSPHRTKRPWQGAEETIPNTGLPSYDPKCYLCPNNTRSNGEQNPRYKETFAFINDFSAVKETQLEYVQPECVSDSPEADLLKASPEIGKCYVICFRPEHNLTLADLSHLDIVTVVDTWTNIYRSHLSPASPLLSNSKTNGNATRNGTIRGPQLSYMQIFENKGSAMGCSNHHPHGQIWTTSYIPEEPARELRNLLSYHSRKNTHLLVDYCALELQKQERVVYSNASFLVVCPWWAVWPFETMIIARQHKRGLVDFSPKERLQLADAISKTVVRYDNLFETSFPYTMGIHQAPLDCTEEEAEASHFHVHFFPPLLRSATVKKFMVGFELLGEPQRDITPEQAAKLLRDCSDVLYRKKT
ncbi:hypothetical protein FKW77_008200 [Venturia effusa]|uniref:Galactose-1-phosphate uridylyltransferase n=1 Tax=Venturia effusa TaxID=50376 RepID=A0A517LCU0_9PEZI|nr:hypothetical protein FKW77_008200 [Venturia effusa]